MKPVYLRPVGYGRWCILRHYVHDGPVSALCFARMAGEELEISAAPPFADRCSACGREQEALQRGGPNAPLSPEEWERQSQGASREWIDPKEVSTRR